MATSKALRVPLPISKAELGGNPTVKSAIGIVGGAIMRSAKTLKTPAAWIAFWTGLQAYCTRNLAEAEGVGGSTPPPLVTAGKPPATARTAAVSKTAGGGGTPKRAHRKAAGATA